MRFCFVITNLSGGGAEKIVLVLAEGLARRGHRVNCILLEDRIEHEVPPGVECIPLGRRLRRGWLGKRWLAWKLRRVVGTLAPDLAVSALPFANEVAKIARLRNLVFRVDNNLSAEIAKLAAGDAARGKRRALRYRRLYEGETIIAVSAGVGGDLEKYTGRAGEIIVAPNPCDVAGIRRAALQSDDGLPAFPYVLHVGRFNTQKRHDLLLDSWMHVQSGHKLVLLTRFDSRLNEMIVSRGLGDRVLIAGFRKNPYPWMKRADALVLSSDYEGLPTVLVEGLACGTRVVSTDCPSGPREILVGELASGLVPCGDPSALAAAIVSTLLRPRPSPELLDAALQPYLLDLGLDLYERLAGGKTPGRTLIAAHA